MVSLRSFVVLASTLATVLASPVDIQKRDISQSLLNDFVRYTKYSSAAYQLLCPSPLGQTLVEQFSELTTNTQGFIVRDDSRKEIVVAFRGSFQAADFLTDLDIILIPLKTAGVSVASGVSVHQGFGNSFNSVASNIISVVKSQLASHPGYTLVSTGHSLGAALASLGGLSLKSNFPASTVRLFTFGQPRTGNPAYANLVESVVGTANIYRAVHTFDGVPTILPQALGYRHHGTEFWNFQDPATTSTVKQCAGQEDPTCSDSIPSTGINIAHISYFGQNIALDPLLCV